MRLEDLGWNDFFASKFATYRTSGEGTGGIAGRVCEQHRDLYRVLTVSGEVVANVSGRFRGEIQRAADLPAVGDWVALRMREASRAAIQRVLPRESQLSRRAAGARAEEQIIAANVDTVFIVTAMDADFSLRRIERYLLQAHDSGVRPVVVLSKSDIADDVEGKRLACTAIAPQTPVHAISAATRDGIESLRPYLGRGQTAAFVGSSGVGKSTLVNALFGTDVQVTRAVRRSDNKGRHTTTYRRLIPLPGGALLLDTPGMREVQLWADEEALDAMFDDVAAAAEGCRFRDCRHQQEPGCAVRGQIADERLQSFHKQQKELAHLHRQTDMQAAQAEKRRWKAIHKHMRNFRSGGKG